jgi:hypothetical protein
LVRGMLHFALQNRLLMLVAAILVGAWVITLCRLAQLHAWLTKYMSVIHRNIKNMRDKD